MRSATLRQIYEQPLADFQWPNDLLKPALVLLLRLPDAARQARLQRRGEGYGKWESLLQDRATRARIDAGFDRQVRGGQSRPQFVPTTVLNAAAAPEEVASEAVAQCKASRVFSA